MITNCKRYGVYRIEGGGQSNVFATECDTGLGLSGAQAYLHKKDGPKWFGIISGDVVKLKEGQTTITKFDESLFEIVDKLRSRGTSANPKPNDL